MRQRHLVFLILWTVAAGWARAAEKPPAFDAAPASARGTFVQRKVLKDLDVTLTSSGTFRFEKGAFFEWTTVRPVRSVFTATPTNWSFAASGRTAVHPLAVDVSSFEKIFEIKEVKAESRHLVGKLLMALGFKNLGASKIIARIARKRKTT